MCVRWGNSTSPDFLVGNGVRQGGIISPILFKIYIYIDDLSMHLNSSGIGGYLGMAFINHLCYADGLCVISLSSSGMQQLLHNCNEYAAEHQLINHQMRKMYAHANLLLRKLSKCSVNVKC